MTRPRANNFQVQFVQVPTFLTVDPLAFDPSYFLRSAEESQVKDGENVEKSQSRRLHNVNTIRWKFSRDSEGNMTKESNSRYIKWSDGSMSLQLGDEIFDVIEKPITDTFLALSHPAQEVLQTAAVLKKSMTYVPTSTSSKTHKRLKEELHKQVQSNNNVVGNWATTDDPEKVKREAEKAEEINNKARKKLEQKKRALEDRNGYESGGRADRGFSRYDSEAVHDNDRSGGRDAYEEDDFVVNDEDEDEDEDEERAQRLKDLKRKGAESYKKRRAASDEDEDDEEEEEVEDEEEEPEAEFTDDEESRSRQRSKKQRRIEDDEDDE